MEDVLYLKKHADVESFLFVVDSARRDTSVFPHPNEYEVHFKAPFRNVVGLDLLDATVPRTEYLVEAGANALVYTYGGTKHTATVPPGDYTVLQLAEALNAELASQVQGGLTVSPVTTPAEVSNRVRFLSDRPLVIHVAESTLRRALGLGVGGSLSVTQGTQGILGPRAVVTGPLPSIDTLPLTTPRRQAFVTPATGTLTSVQVYVASDAVSTVLVAVLNAQGQLVASGSAQTTASDFEQLVVPLESVTLAANQACHVLLYSTGSTASVFCASPGVSSADASPPEGAAWWGVANWTAGTDAMCLDVAMDADGFVLEPPGVVDLTGESYVLVRCPEIEQQLYRDRAFETVHAGMGLIKLGNYGFRDQRFDFSSFPPRTLPTPIGKLGKLTFRLEKADGTLYDTKGVNHHMVLVVRYLELNKGPENMTSTLNPAYTPNPLEYMQRTTYAPVHRPGKRF